MMDVNKCNSHSTRMNWYFEIDGVSQGPVSESVLALKVQAGDLPSQTLIWNASLAEWEPAGVLKPEWLKPIIPTMPAASAPKHAAARTPTKPLAPSKTEEPVEEKPGFFKKLFGRGKKS
jgi:hypothetical protein